MRVKTSKLTKQELCHVLSLPDLSWHTCGPLIGRERIELCIDRCDDRNLTWHATIELKEQYLDGEGPTPLIAAMRCLVASKLGYEVEIPEGLV